MAFLQGRSAIVTGAAGGIGSAVVTRLAAEQAFVVAVDRRLPPGCQDIDGQVRWLEADVADAQAMEHASAIAAEAAPLAVCVANAGVLLIEDLLDGVASRWEQVMRINVLGVMTGFQAAANAMIAAGCGGRLIATASVAGLRGEAGSSAYCASKAAVVNLAQSLALELAKHEITVNAVAPGEVDTAMHHSAMEKLAAQQGISPVQLRGRIVEQIPLGRMATPDDVAGVVAFLASPDARYLTGLTIRVDGGQLLI
ncbi:MAG TPA: SDR family NAD(P)-dependent oxidoreductase [Solirubrobacteraceae bacterium]|jgi:NAD(P)-dependent dehydrogenase (short-subunit alcohol dehydrogenase family)|nr:SDR family NAD(P)-dependent oxidoreductase [Solirubrobacteraceae bacterium]